MKSNLGKARLKGFRKDVEEPRPKKPVKKLVRKKPAA
jgi:hypothetical protein